MRPHTIALIIIFIAGSARGEGLWRDEILTGKKDDQARALSNVIFDYFELKHEWGGAGGIKIRVWESAGCWPGKFPVIAQVISGTGELVDAKELELPAARPVEYWAFDRMGSHLVINIDCVHRHHPENGVYAFRVDMQNKLMSGGPVIAKEALSKSGKILPDLVADAGGVPTKSEQTVPSDGQKPSGRVPSDGPTAPADAH